MFWILAFYAVYVLAVLVGRCAAKRWGYPQTYAAVRRAQRCDHRGGAAATFKTILTTDYADIYGAYYGGGFGNNCLGQLRTQGLIWLVLCAAGLVWLLYCRSTRAQAIVAAAASLGAMVLFTRTQSWATTRA